MRFFRKMTIGLFLAGLIVFALIMIFGPSRFRSEVADGPTPVVTQPKGEFTETNEAQSSAGNDNIERREERLDRRDEPAEDQAE